MTHAHGYHRAVKPLTLVLWALLSTAIFGCGDGEPVSIEDCALAGDEDANGAADCGDPACADTPSCRPACGNGAREAGEACDDGNLTSGDGCDGNCTPTACGNGIATAGEACDDGNAIDTDNCRDSCQLPLCGDGVASTGATDSHHEDCDGASSGGMTPVETATCNLDCTAQVCGDGKRNQTAGEQCDDGNASNTDACTNVCLAAVCSDGYLQDMVEQCDDGNTVTEVCTYGVPSCTVCSATCVPVPGQTSVCGDLIVQSPFETCDDGNAVDGDWCNQSCMATALAPVYLKASNAEASDQFGIVAMSADGSTLAVSARMENGGATGVDGDQADNSIPVSGAVYIFIRSGTTWVQQAYIKASNPGLTDHFGLALALSADGSTLAVAAPFEASAATGINGNQTSNSAAEAGAVYVFTRSGTTWSQQAYIKASNTGAGDWFGRSLALSGDGSTLAVGAPFEDSGATGVDGNQADNSAAQAGAVYVFTRSGATWSQETYVKEPATSAGANFGQSVALSGDGSILGVGAHYRGEVHVFARAGTMWSPQALVRASNHAAFDFFGQGIALSADGSTLAVGAPFEASAATGVGGDQADNSAASAGAVYVFTRSGTTWTQQAYVKASNTGAGDFFGGSIVLSGDGSTLAVGAVFEDSAATGVNGNQSSNSAADAGAVYVFTRSGATWTQQAYVKASNTDANDRLSGGVGLGGVALSGDGSSLAVGAPGEASAATGVGGNQADNFAAQAGAVYVFR